MESILEYTMWALALASALAFGSIKNYLVKRKLVKWKLAYWNPFDFFGKYIKSTKEESGKIGIWFWILIYSVASLFILSLLVKA